LLLCARDWYFIAEQPAPAPYLAHPEEYAALRIVLVTVPRDSCSCEHFPDGFDLHLLRSARPPRRVCEYGTYVTVKAQERDPQERETVKSLAP